MKTWLTYGFDKIVADKPAPATLKKNLALYLTKGGKGTCQIAVNCDIDTSVSFKTVSCDVKCDVYCATHLLTVKDHQYTDPMLPYGGEAVNVKGGLSIAFYLDFKAENSGDYTAVFEVTENGNTELLTVSLHVWSFALPTDKAFATACGIDLPRIAKIDPSPDVYKKYYDFFLDFNLCAYRIPYDILDERADEYLSDPRVTSFCIPDGEDEGVIARAAKVRSNPKWLKKALFYSIDEPHTLEQVETFKVKVERLRSLASDIHSITPFYTNMQMGENTDQVDVMAPYTDLWCPKLSLWDDERSYGKFLNYTPEKSFETRMNEFIDKGQPVWSYVCNSPASPYAQMFIDTDGLMHRLILWQHYQRRIIGFLYWGVNYWLRGDVSSWEEPYNGISGEGGHVHGCGYLVYPGDYVGYNAPVPTNRLFILRDGIDDVELLAMAEKLLGRDWVMERVNEATPSLTSYTTHERFEEIRKEIGDAIEAALNK